MPCAAAVDAATSASCLSSSHCSTLQMRLSVLPVPAVISWQQHQRSTSQLHLTIPAHILFTSSELIVKLGMGRRCFPCGALEQTDATTLQPAVHCSHEVLLDGVRRVIGERWELRPRLRQYPCTAVPCKH